MKSQNLWIPFSRLFPLPTDLVEIERDGRGERRRMRIPCPAFDEMTRNYPDALHLFRYRLQNTPQPGDEVRFKYVHRTGGLKDVEGGVVTRRDGAYVYVAAEMVRDAKVTIFERECYDSELVLIRDEAFMLLHGEL